MEGPFEACVDRVKLNESTTSDLLLELAESKFEICEEFNARVALVDYVQVTYVFCICSLNNSSNVSRSKPLCRIRIRMLPLCT